jgi:ABC-2 type transport system permease protein
MNKVLRIARREFAATAMTKGFIIGVFVLPPVLLGILLVGFAVLMTEKPPSVEGTVAVIDRSGAVAEGIAERLSPEALAERQQRAAEQAREMLEQAGERFGVEAPGGALAAAAGDAPRLTVEPMPADTDPEPEKLPLREGGPFDGGRLALIVVAPDAVQRGESEAFGSYELFIRPRLDDRIQGLINAAVRDAIRDSRIRAHGLEPGLVDALVRVQTPRAVEVTERGERRSAEAMSIILPLGLMILMMTAVFVGGQYLLTTTIEEKSSRVVEVLLSAVSPMQLMTGKIVGQMWVGLLLLAIYGGIGGGGLVLFRMGDLLDAQTIVYTVIFFFIAYFLIAASLAAIGASVNDLREAQALQTPVMMAVMLPYLLALPISRNPSGLFATVMSFIPPINPFVMILRVASTEPPPTWQVLVSILIGLAAVYAVLWAAAKIFRIGLLMYGKPPNLATLFRWLRMA